MSINTRSKGKRGELEVVRLLQAAGHQARRNLDQTRDGGVDVISDIGTFEVKVGKQVPDRLYKWANQNEADYLVVRGDRQRWLVVMDIERLLGDKD